MFLVLPLYAPAVDFKPKNQDVIEMQIMSFNRRGL